MPPYGNEDDHDDFAAALSFPVAGQADADYDSGDASAALGFAVADDGGEDSAVDMAHGYAPAEHQDTEIELDTIHSQETENEEEGDGLTLFTVTNPPGSVSVSALGDGGIEKISLSEKVASLTESQLAEEILVVAHLAGQKGQAAQHEFLFENMRELGADDTDALHDLLENGMQLTSPEQAAETQAQVFAARYATDH